MPGDVDSRQRRQGERRGLAGAGLRLAEHVGAGQQHRYGGRLDGRWRLVTHIGQGAQHGFGKSEVAKGGGSGRDNRGNGAHGDYLQARTPSLAV